MSTNGSGRFVCPKCHAEMAPMRGGKGWRCATPGNRWLGGRWSICDGVRWNNSGWTPRPQTPRAVDWLRLANPTDEQQHIDADLALSPDARGGRLIIIDAGPGCAKTTQLATSAHTIYKRVGLTALVNWHLAAFGVNAKQGIQEKIPAHWANIATLNGLFGGLQGYKAPQYKPGKSQTIFRELVSHLPDKDRPRFGPLRSFLERCRDSLLYSGDAGDKSHWHEVIGALIARFPGLGKKLSDQTAQTVREYLPLLATRSHADSRTIDLSEQYTRPVCEAIARSGWRMPARLVDRAAQWEAADIAHLAALIRKVSLPQVAGLIVDEAQDLSPAQIVCVLACTWRQGELVLVGDDFGADPYKAGQAIFGWRGAFPGSLAFIARLWAELTGETALRRSLSVTHRCPPEIVAAVQPLNTVLRSSKPEGSGAVYSASAQAALNRWLNIPPTDKKGKPYRAMWLTRRNGPLGDVFMETLRSRRKVCLRGGGDMTAKIDSALYDAAGWYDNDGEYKVKLAVALDKLRTAVAEQSDGGPADADSMEAFLITVGEAIQSDPAILREAELQPVATVGNLRRFVLYFATADAPRVLSTVYRAKGDEAHLVIVDDTEALNADWNGDSQESAAVRHVACTRASETLLLIGSLRGVIVSETLEDAPADATQLATAS